MRVYITNALYCSAISAHAGRSPAEGWCNSSAFFALKVVARPIIYITHFPMPLRRDNY
jgi:hypothetical protein